MATKQDEWSVTEEVIKESEKMYNDLEPENIEIEQSELHNTKEEARNYVLECEDGREYFLEVEPKLEKDEPSIRVDLREEYSTTGTSCKDKVLDDYLEKFREIMIIKDLF